MSEIDDVELLDKRGYLTICVSLVKDGKIYLRRTEGIREWFRAVRVSGIIRALDRWSGGSCNTAFPVFCICLACTGTMNDELMTMWWRSVKLLGCLKLLQGSAVESVSTNCERNSSKSDGMH